MCYECDMLENSSGGGHTHRHTHTHTHTHTHSHTDSGIKNSSHVISHQMTHHNTCRHISTYAYIQEEARKYTSQLIFPSLFPNSTSRSLLLISLSHIFPIPAFFKIIFTNTFLPVFSTQFSPFLVLFLIDVVTFFSFSV